MGEVWLIIGGLAIATFTIRLFGAIAGQRLPQAGAWARAIGALPGSLIVALVSVSLLSGGIAEWSAAAIAVVVAILTRSLPLTMVAGIAAVWVMRQLI